MANEENRGQKHGGLCVPYHPNDKRNRLSMPQSSVADLGVIEITYPSIRRHCINPSLPGNSTQRSERRGEKVNGEVMAPRHGMLEHAFCMLAHDVLNKVSAIIGFCDLVEIDHTEAEKQNHLSRMRATALLIADMLNERSCCVVVCSPDKEKPVQVPQKKPPDNLEPDVFGRSSASYVAIQHL